MQYFAPAKHGSSATAEPIADVAHSTPEHVEPALDEPLGLV